MNDTPKHTPGPWTLDGEDESMRFVRSPCIGPIALLMEHDSGETEWTQDEANARLIARSPAMYEVCSLLDSLDCCAGYSLPEADYPKLWDAIEKARAVLATISGPEDAPR